MCSSFSPPKLNMPWVRVGSSCVSGRSCVRAFWCRCGLARQRAPHHHELSWSLAFGVVPACSGQRRLWPVYQSQPCFGHKWHSRCQQLGLLQFPCCHRVEGFCGFSGRCRCLLVPGRQGSRTARVYGCHQLSPSPLVYGPAWNSACVALRQCMAPIFACRCSRRGYRFGTCADSQRRSVWQ